MTSRLGLLTLMTALMGSVKPSVLLESRDRGPVRCRRCGNHPDLVFGRDKACPECGMRGNEARRAGGEK